MLFTVHLLAGATLGAVIKRPVAALAAGIASHFILDTVPHWSVGGGLVDWVTIARYDGVISLIVLTVVLFWLPSDRRLAAGLGALGAALPDLSKPAHQLLGIDPYPQWLEQFHASIQTERVNLWWVEILTASSLVTILWALRRADLRKSQKLSDGDQEHTERELNPMPEEKTPAP